MMVEQQNQTAPLPKAGRENTAPKGRRAVDTTHDPLVDFAIRWVHFGGGSAEDIFVTFGIGTRIYFERLLDSLASLNLDPVLHQRLSLVAQKRLAAITKASSAR